MTPPLSPLDHKALTWWVNRITQAEKETGNPKAILNGRRYKKAMREQLSANPDVLTGIVAEYEKEAAAGTLDEPLWTKRVGKAAEVGRVA
jgi:hypothetical protein